MARYRRDLDWEGQLATAIDPETARAMFESSDAKDGTSCTMCGEFCAIKVARGQDKDKKCY